MISATHFWIDDEEYAKIVHQFSGTDEDIKFFRFSFQESNYSALFNDECGIRFNGRRDERIRLSIIDKKKFLWAKIKYGI